MQIDEPWYFALERLHAFGESVAQAVHDLEQRKIDIGQPAARSPGAAACVEQPLEIAEKFRQAFLPEFSCALVRLAPLVLIIERGPERMMGVVNFEHEIGNRQLQLMHPKLCCFRLRCEAMP